MQNIARYLSLTNEELKQVIIGCAKSVLLGECQWYRKRLRPRKPSQRQLALSSLIWPSLSLSEDPEFKDGIRQSTYAKARLVKVGLESNKVDPPNVNRAFKTYENIGYFHNTEGRPKHDGLSGRNRIYAKTEFISNLEKLVLALKPRAIIYRILARSKILERHLTLCNYVELIRCRRIKVKDAIEVRKSFAITPLLSQDIEEYEKLYIKSQELLKHKSNNEIFLEANKKSKIQLLDKHDQWHSDLDYTRFFIKGGIAYNEVRIVYSN